MSTTIDNAELAKRLEELAKKATPGPYKFKIEPERYHESDDADLPGFLRGKDGVEVAYFHERYGKDLSHVYEANGELCEALLQNLPTILSALRAQEGWRTDLENAPRDGTVFHVWAPGYEWPETVMWVHYDKVIAEEIGELGFWAYADDLLTAATDDCGHEAWTHWRHLPAAPQEAGR